ncbi:MAG: hypothetical protein EOO68_03135 [Moraxellaceae bacterium]|nr:MAG: hypothetical protein EOO68_03135 [Moraxellaceae bacterium]
MKMMFTRDRNLLIVATLLMAAITYYFYLYQHTYPPCCDAVSYLGIAASIDNKGFLESQVPLRTFAYPLLLISLAKISALSTIKYSFLMLTFQFIFYMVAILNALSFFGASLKSTSARIILLLVMCTNIYLAPYIALALTDSIYVSLCLIVITNICKLFSKNDVNYRLICITVFLALLAIVIRPTAVWLVAPLVFYVMMLIFSKRISYFSLIGALAVAALPLFIQIWINSVRFGAFTFFPATDLGSAQIDWGINNIKYATWMGNGASQNYYPSSKLITVVNEGAKFTIDWYFNNILDGMKLVAVKLVGAFDFDYLLPYPYFKHKNFWLPSIFSFAIMFFGICGIIYHAITNNIQALGNRLLPLIIFISWGAVTLVSALELRFTLPILSYFMIVSILYLNEINVRHQKSLIIFSLAGFLLTLPVLITIASFVRDQSTITG